MSCKSLKFVKQILKLGETSILFKLCLKMQSKTLFSLQNMLVFLQLVET